MRKFNGFSLFAVALLAMLSTGCQPAPQPPEQAQQDAPALSFDLAGKLTNVEGLLQSRGEELQALSECVGELQRDTLDNFAKVDAKLDALAEKIGDGSKVSGTVATSTPSQPTPVATSTKATATTTVQPRWINHDGLSLRDHIIQVHGLDPSLSDAELIAAHDAWHDQYGGAPPTQVMGSGSRTIRYSTTRSSCPGGRCPTSGTTYRRGLLGFRWLRR